MRWRLVVAAGLFSAICSPSVAAPINYGDFNGTTVTYLQVTEGTVPSGAGQIPLFAAPTISGNTLDFDPTGFSESASGASGACGFDSTAGNLEFDIARWAKIISSVRLTEAGNTTLLGFGTDATFSSVTANIVIDIEEVNGLPTPGGALNVPATMVFTPSGGDFGMATDGGGGPTFNSGWSGLAPIDLDQALTDAGVSFTGGATLVTVSLTNTLVALSENGTQSLITKQDADSGVVVTVNIPEPTSVALGVLVCVAVAGTRRV